MTAQIIELAERRAKTRSGAARPAAGQPAIPKENGIESYLRARREMLAT